MNRPVLIIEMPDLTCAQAAGIEDFLHAFINAFENHYARQLRTYYQRLELEFEENFDSKNSFEDDDELPF